jgi:CheY-like chemotaxis protein
MSASALQILLVDDHTILRRGLRLMLEKLPGVEVVSETGSCLAALEQIAADNLDLIIRKWRQSIDWCIYDFEWEWVGISVVPLGT